MSCSNVFRGSAALIGLLLAAQSMSAAPEEGLVCRYQERPGSRVLAHPCLSEAQWAEIDKRQAATNPLANPSALPGLAISAGGSAGGGPGTVTGVSVNLNR